MKNAQYILQKSPAYQKKMVYSKLLRVKLLEFFGLLAKNSALSRDNKYDLLKRANCSKAVQQYLETDVTRMRSLLQMPLELFEHSLNSASVCNLKVVLLVTVTLQWRRRLNNEQNKQGLSTFYG